MSEIAEEVRSGFDAMGYPVPYFRKQAAYDLLRTWGLKAELANAVSSAMSEQLKRDKPHEAMEIAKQTVDLTGAYRLMAVLLAGEKP